MCTSGRVLLASCVSLILLLPAASPRVAQAAEEYDDLQQAKLAAEGFLANYAAFPHYRCEMQIRCLEIHGPQRALTDGVETELASGAASLLVDGPRLCYKRSSDDQIKWTPGTNKGSMMLTPSTILKDAEFHMSGSPLMQAVAITPLAKAGPLWRGVDITTWNGAGALADRDNGMFGTFLGPQLDADLKETRVTVRPGPSVDGAATQEIETAYRTSRIVFRVDPKRGFLPLETDSYLVRDGQEVLYIKMQITDIEHCSGDRWFPTRVVATWAPNPDGDRIVRDVTVTELDVDNRPPEESFFLFLTRNSQILEPHDGGTSYNVDQATKVTLQDLPALYERLPSK